MLGPFIFIAFGVIVILAIVASTLYVVRQQSVAIVERFGRYQKTATSGIHIRLPFGIDKIAARVQLRLYSQKSSLKPKPRTMCL